MKNEERKPVGSLLGQNVLEDKNTDSEILYAGCVGLVLALFLAILLLIMLITKWSPFDIFEGIYL